MPSIEKICWVLREKIEVVSLNRIVVCFFGIQNSPFTPFVKEQI